MIVGAPRHWTSIIETLHSINFQEQLLFKISLPAWKPGLNCGFYRYKITEGQHCKKIIADLNQGSCQMISECIVHQDIVNCIVWDMEAEGMFENLFCLQLQRESVSNSHRNTRIGRSSIGKNLCGPMNLESSCIMQLFGWEFGEISVMFEACFPDMFWAL